MRRSPGGSLSGGGFFKQESFLEFDYAQGRWTYRIDEIAGAGVTDNVIDLMMRNIQRLSSKTQRILTLASCIGNPFGLRIADCGWRIGSRIRNPQRTSRSPQSAICNPRSTILLLPARPRATSRLRADPAGTEAGRSSNGWSLASGTRGPGTRRRAVRCRASFESRKQFDLGRGRGLGALQDQPERRA